MRKVKDPAEWCLELWVYCPYCEEFQKVEWVEIPDYFEKLEILASQEGIEIVHKCDNKECGQEFIIDKTVW